MTDELKKFVFDAAPVRGELVRLEGTWQEVLSRRRYPAPVSTLLGEMMAAAALLSANLKFNGALVMQLHGDGPVHMLVVECNSDLSMRATAKIAEGAEIADDATLADVDDDNVFTPGLDANYDLRKPSSRGAELLLELIAFCHLDIDTSVLDGPSIDRDDWREVLAEVRTCLHQDD